MSMDRPDAHELCAAVAQRIERNELDLMARIRAELPSYTRLSPRASTAARCTNWHVDC